MSQPTASHRTLQLHPADNIGITVTAMRAGEPSSQGIMLSQDIPAGHKYALRTIAEGQPVVKFGYPIGVATAPISPGQHVHTHNVASALASEIVGKSFTPTRHVAPNRVSNHRFDGYVRRDGRAAIRNEIWIVNTVACVNNASQRIAAKASALYAGPGRAVEGVHAFVHPLGCSQLGDDLRYTQKALAGLVNHPNAAAVLILGLGCENNQLKGFLDTLGPIDRNRVRYFNAQDVADEETEGVRAIGELAEYASQFKLQSLPASELVLGMKCGGSDGFSGITANPLVGAVADRMTHDGATVLLTEVPEMFGAEAMLLERAADAAAFDATIKLVNDFRDYFRQHNQPIDENPSPGNKAGGITTLAEKSLGCVQKGGSSPIRQVLSYGQAAPPHSAGVALVNAPGNDGVSGTAMTIAGAHMILFTTGRGTPMGFPAPTIKIATNTDLATRKPTWIDFNAGPIADGEQTIESLADKLLELVLNVASGKTLTQSERHGYREIAIWKNGVTL